jgi:hypothetical protein
MKKVFYLFILAAFAACSGGSRYEKTIAGYLETDRNGSRFDLKFKALEMHEIARYTVADSIRFISDAFEKDRAKRLAALEESIKSDQESMEKEKSGHFVSKTMLDFYEGNITKCRKAVDSLKTLNPSDIQKYENRKPDEVLAIVVRCKYSVVPPVINTRVEETFDFILSPDGLKCYGKRRAK